MQPPTRTHITLLLSAPVYAALCHYVYTSIEAGMNTIYVVLVSVLSFLYTVEAAITLLSLIVSPGPRTLIDTGIVVIYSIFSLSVLKQATSIGSAGGLATIASLALFLAGLLSSLYGAADSGRILFAGTQRRKKPPPYIRI